MMSLIPPIRFRSMKRVKPPWYYAIIAYLNRHSIRGSSRLFNAASRLGLLNQVCQFSLSDTLRIDVPLNTDNIWDEAALRAYELAVVARLAKEAESLPKPIKFIDCGANFGIFSLNMFSHCDHL